MTRTETNGIRPVSGPVGARIANASLVAALAVVLLHVVLMCFPSPPAHPVCLFLRDFARFAVPFFFLVSGYLLAGHGGEAGWWSREARKRLRTLVAPYLAWSVLFGLYLLLGSFVAEGCRFDAFDFAAWWADKQGVLFGTDLFEAPLMLPLWFLRTLFLLVLLSGVLTWFVCRFGKTTLSVLGVLYLLYAVLVDVRPAWTDHGLLALLRMTFAPEAFFYFALGLWLRRNDIPSPAWRALPFLLVAVVLLTLRSFLGAWVPYPVIVPFALLGVWKAVPDTPWPRPLTAQVFPVYLLHWFFVHAVARAGFVSGTAAWAFPPTLLSVWAVSFAVAFALRWLSPPAAGLLFGGR